MQWIGSIVMGSLMGGLCGSFSWDASAQAQTRPAMVVGAAAGILAALLLPPCIEGSVESDFPTFYSTAHLRLRAVSIVFVWPAAWPSSRSRSPNIPRSARRPCW